MRTSVIPWCLLIILPVRADHQQGLVDLKDTLLARELSQVGGYPEMARPLGFHDVEAAPIFSWGPGHTQFRTEDLRVRIECQPFEPSADIRWKKDHALLDGVPMIGWWTDAAHMRLSKVEVVVDGLVLSPPVESTIDVFAPRPCEAYGNRVLQFSSVARSRDGYRIYVQVLAGQGEQARLVTWVFEEGHYLCRVIDRFRVPG